jgi:hypothetical protein
MEEASINKSSNIDTISVIIGVFVSIFTFLGILVTGIINFLVYAVFYQSKISPDLAVILFDVLVSILFGFITYNISKSWRGK